MKIEEINNKIIKVITNEEDFDLDEYSNNLIYIENQNILTFGDTNFKVLEKFFLENGYNPESLDLCLGDDKSIGLEMPKTWYLNKGKHALSIAAYYNYLNFHGIVENKDLETFNAKIAKVVFLDPLTNTVELRMTDIEAVIKQTAKEKLDDDIYFVIDGTMISGEINPFSAGNGNLHVKVLYYDSCSKYLQLGLDIAMGGLVAIPVELTALFDRLRRNTGAIMYDSASNIFPAYSREIHDRRMRRMSRNAILIGNAIDQDPELAQTMQAHYPILKSHQDHVLAKKFNSVGGLMTFTFNNPALNQRDSLNSFIETALLVAKKHGVSLTKGVSFGFSLPRISAATAMAENAPPFLRLSVGDRSYNETKMLAVALIEAFRRYIYSFNSFSDGDVTSSPQVSY